MFAPCCFIFLREQAEVADQTIAAEGVCPGAAGRKGSEIGMTTELSAVSPPLGFGGLAGPGLPCPMRSNSLWLKRQRNLASPKAPVVAGFIQMPWPRASLRGGN